MEHVPGAKPAERGVTRRTLVFGAGHGGRQIVRSIQHANSQWVVVGVLDDDPSKVGTEVAGVPVLGGRDGLPHFAAQTGADVLIIAAPSRSDVTRQVGGEATRCGLAVKVVPPLDELLRDWIDVRDVRDLNLDDLLGRHHVDLDTSVAAGYVSGRTVLVTGAGGSIGRELCRQLAELDPALLLMLDRDESALHGTALSLGMGGGLNRRNFVLADIRDARRLRQVMELERPQVVFHAAALKHVQSLERHPGEAVQTNVWGTLNVLRAAAEVGVDRFVNISTDKAADPVNVLGHSKRLAEGLTAWFGEQQDGHYVSTRFGNVLGSRGSVLETFAAQLSRGEALTVSHPDATRFLMAIDEAVRLVVHAGAIGSSGEALVLDMGDPVRILDIAAHLVARGGRGTIEFTGLSAGEKLHEVLHGAGEVGVTRQHPLVTHVAVPPLDPAACEALDPWADSREVVVGMSELTSGLRPPRPALTVADGSGGAVGADQAPAPRSALG